MQSSTHKPEQDKYFTGSSAAVDGCYDGVMNHNCCTHTKADKGPGWWSVDLERIFIVNSVKVFNRADQR